jgi:hypothetical protein
VNKVNRTIRKLGDWVKAFKTPILSRTGVFVSL